MRRSVNTALLRKLWSTSYLDRDIAERMGHHRGVLRRTAKQLGLPPRNIARREREMEHDARG